MNVISEPSRQLLALSLLSGVGPAALKKVINLPGFGNIPMEHLAIQVPSIGRAMSESSAWEIAQEGAERQIIEARRHNAEIISILDENYPTLLAATRDDPLILFVRGNLSRTPLNSVAIIGTREPTVHGQVIAARIAQFFVERQWSIVSGLAIGCDSIAHEATLEAGGHTVAVLAHGLQMVAPSRNRNLADRILASGGALVSEYPFGREVQRQQYVKRDRTQAGLAQGVVMIQSDIVGGSLHASRASLEYRRWLAVPFPTERDRDCQEPKIQANLMISLGDDSEKANLLRCPESALENILVLKSRDDYMLMTGEIQRLNMHSTVFKNLEPFEKSTNSKNESMLFDGVDFSNSQIKNNSNNGVGDVKPKSVLQTRVDRLQKYKSILKFSVPDEWRQGPWAEVFGEDLGVALAMSSRLDYLEERLQIVYSSLEKSKKSGSVLSQRALCFSIDDFVSQMMHSVELLNAIYQTLSESINYRRPIVKEHAVHIASIERKILQVLQDLKDSSTSRLIFSSTKNNEKNNEGDWLEVLMPRLEELCDDLNQFLQLILVDAYSSAPDVTRLAR